MLIQHRFSIDIIEDILKRPDALDTYLGGEVSEFLLKKIADVQQPTLLEIDVRKANPIDYLFTKSAFGEFYKVMTESDNLDCLFYINKSQVPHLFWGLLAFMDGNIHRNGNHEKDFEIVNNIKIGVSNQPVRFIGDLKDFERDILEFINSKNIVADEIVHQAFSSSISHSNISSAIDRLTRKKFIYSDISSIPNKIYSITSKII